MKGHRKDRREVARALCELRADGIDLQDALDVLAKTKRSPLVRLLRSAIDEGNLVLAQRLVPPELAPLLTVSLPRDKEREVFENLARYFAARDRVELAPLAALAYPGMLLAFVLLLATILRRGRGPLTDPSRPFHFFEVLTSPWIIGALLTLIAAAGSWLVWRRGRPQILTPFVATIRSAAGVFPGAKAMMRHYSVSASAHLLSVMLPTGMTDADALSTVGRAADPSSGSVWRRAARAVSAGQPLLKVLATTKPLGALAQAAAYADPADFLRALSVVAKTEFLAAEAAASRLRRGLFLIGFATAAIAAALIAVDVFGMISSLPGRIG